MCCPQEVTGEQAELFHSWICLVRTGASSFVLGMFTVAFPLTFPPHLVLWAGAGLGGRVTASLDVQCFHLQ